MKKLCYFLSLILVLFILGCGGGREVEVTQPARGEIRQSFTEPARTRLDKTWRIVMPIGGRIGRIDLEPGDKVEKNQSLVSFDLVPLKQSLAEAEAAVREMESQIQVNEYDKLEETALAQSKTAIDAAEEALKASQAQVEAEKARTNRAEKELARKEELALSNAISQSELEDYQLDAETALIELRKQQFMTAAMNAIVTAYKLWPKFINEWLGRKSLQKEVIAQQLTQARARLARNKHELELADVRSPISGVILERCDQGDSYLSAGAPLLLLGDLDEMEVLAEVLTQDALRIGPGSEVSLDSPALDQALSGKVKKIEPAGFTKLSSLGVEQQRVNVIVSLDERPRGLGVGYRLQARFFTGYKKDALIVPRFSVLQEPDGSFYVFIIERGKLVKREIKIGLRSDLEMEVTAGLTPENVIVSTPDSTMQEGDQVQVKK